MTENACSVPIMHEAIPRIEGVHLEKVALFTRCMRGVSCVYLLPGLVKMTRLIYNDTRIHGSTLYKRICVYTFVVGNL